MGACKRHGRASCSICRDDSTVNPSDNAGKIGMDLDGDLTMGIGGGMGIDLTDGSLTVGGIDMDGR